jgi:lysophospholipase
LRVWKGKRGQPAVLYLHGIEGHGEWFAHTASQLNEHGLSVYVPDRRGAGLNTPSRGHLNSYRDYLADMELLLRRIGEQHSNEDIILFGNCWGAKAAALIAGKGYKSTDGKALPALSGLLLTCPALFTRVDLKLKEKVRIATDVFSGQDAQLREFEIPIAPEMFTANRKYLDYIESDPLRLKAATSRFFFENFLLSWKAVLAARSLTLPMLLILAQSDRIVNVERVRRWYARVPEGQKSLHVFERALHSLDFEPLLFEEYVAVMLDWITSLAVPR